MTTSLGAVVALAACSSSSSSGSTSDPGAACDAYFDSLSGAVSKCAATALPADLAADQKSRFHTLCLQSLALPGSGFTASDLSACGGAYSNYSCRGSNGIAAACAAKPGGLADGAACNDAAQCKGGLCSHTGGADAGASNSSCGTCATGAATGASCGSTGCVPGNSCVSGTCVADGTVDVGGACTGDPECKTGLACSNNKCAALGGVGTVCSGSQSCQSGLVCDKQACATGVPAGGDCSASAGSCLNSFCDPTSKKCIALTVAHPGAACGFSNGTLVGCALGSCNLTPMTTTGTCPKVISDGQPCTAGDKTAVCDFFATCTNGVCTLGTATCK